MELAAKVGTEMISSLSAKILRENIKEPGRVSFPSVMQHQYNLLCLCVTMPGSEVADQVEDEKDSPEIERKTVPLKIDNPQK